MLSKEDALGFRWRDNPCGTRTKKYIFCCKDCNTQIFVDSSQLKVNKGYCAKCVLKYRKPKLYIENNKKVCNACLRELSLDKFLKNSKKMVYSSSCSKCHNLKKFGINSTQFEELLTIQESKCAICGEGESANDKNKDYKRALAVDHCHQKNTVRGLLCTNCNLMLGHSKDNITTLQNAIKYLEKFT